MLAVKKCQQHNDNSDSGKIVAGIILLWNVILVLHNCVFFIDLYLH